MYFTHETCSLKQECWGCLWTKISSLGNSKAIAGGTIWKIGDKFRTAIPHVPFRFEGVTAFRVFPSPCPAPRTRLKGGCFKGGLNTWSSTKWITSSISPDMTAQASSFLHWWDCSTPRFPQGRMSANRPTMAANTFVLIVAIPTSANAQRDLF